MLQATDQFDLGEMQAVMRIPSIYWGAADALAPDPEIMDFASFMTQPNVFTVAGKWNGHVIGYAQLIQRTSIGGEFHAGFHPNFRGRVASAVCKYAIGRAFTDKGFLKLWAIIASDNRPAVWGARSLGFMPEGRLAGAIVRRVEHDDERLRRVTPVSQQPLRDLLIFGLSRS